MSKYSLWLQTPENVDLFYQSSEWRSFRIRILIRDKYRCMPCWRNEELTIANTVHHLKPIREYPELALDEENCESICPTCHNKEHPHRNKQEKPISSKLKVVKESGNPEVI